MVPVWILTPYGPVLQWGCPHNITTNQSNKPKNVQLVPPQVAYGRRNTGQRPHPRKKVVSILEIESVDPAFGRELRAMKETIDYNKEMLDYEKYITS